MASKVLTLVAIVMFVLAAFGVTFSAFALLPAGLACYAAGRLV